MSFQPVRRVLHMDCPYYCNACVVEDAVAVWRLVVEPNDKVGSACRSFVFQEPGVSGGGFAPQRVSGQGALFGYSASPATQGIKWSFPLPGRVSGASSACIVLCN